MLLLTFNLSSYKLQIQLISCANKNSLINCCEFISCKLTYKLYPHKQALPLRLDISYLQIMSKLKLFINRSRYKSILSHVLALPIFLYNRSIYHTMQLTNHRFFFPSQLKTSISKSTNHNSQKLFLFNITYLNKLCQKAQIHANIVPEFCDNQDK